MKKFLPLLLLCACLFAAPAAAQNLPYVLITSAATTGATVTSPDVSSAPNHGVHVIINVTAYTSGSYTPHIQALDPASGSYYDILVGAPISATGLNVIKVVPGGAPLSNASAADFLPSKWHLQLVGGSSPSMTIGAGYNLEP